MYVLVSRHVMPHPLSDRCCGTALCALYAYSIAVQQPQCSAVRCILPPESRSAQAWPRTTTLKGLSLCSTAKANRLTLLHWACRQCSAASGLQLNGRYRPVLSSLASQLYFAKSTLSLTFALFRGLSWVGPVLCGSRLNVCMYSTLA